MDNEEKRIYRRYKILDNNVCIVETDMLIVHGIACYLAGINIGNTLEVYDREDHKSWFYRVERGEKHDS